MVKLDKMTGATVWTAEELSDTAAYSSIVAPDVRGVRTYMTFTESAGVGVRASDGKLMFRYPAAANRTANVATPVYADNQVFFASGYGTGGGLLDLTVQDGVVWRDRSVGKGSVTYADDRLYIQSENNVVGLAEATPEAYRETGRFEIPDKGAPSWAHLVISDGRLYVRNQDTLLVYDIKASS
jgi:hypothetical protein